jgi:RNA polymerase sigma factor (sigma-70 family)
VNAQAARSRPAAPIEPTVDDYDLAARAAVAMAARSPLAARWLPADDAAQVGRLTCWLVASTYDPARGRWRAYLTAKVRQAVVDLLRATGPITRSGYVRDGSVLEAECLRVVDDRGEDVPVEAWRGRRDPALAQVDLRDALDGATAALDDRSLFVLERYWIDDRSLAAIAAELGLSESRVCQLHSMALMRVARVARASERA